MVATSTSPGVGGTETIKAGNGTMSWPPVRETPRLLGGSGTELIFGGDATVTLSGTTVISYASTDIGSTGGGTDTIKAGSGKDTIYGGPGNDVIHAGTGPDVHQWRRHRRRRRSPATTRSCGAHLCRTLATDFPAGIPPVSHPRSRSKIRLISRLVFPPRLALRVASGRSPRGCIKPQPAVPPSRPTRSSPLNLPSKKSRRLFSRSMNRDWCTTTSAPPTTSSWRSRRSGQSSLAMRPPAAWLPMHPSRDDPHGSQLYPGTDN